MEQLALNQVGQVLLVSVLLVLKEQTVKLVSVDLLWDRFISPLSYTNVMPPPPPPKKKKE